MKKGWLASILLIIYVVFLIKVMVFKDMPTVKIGQLMLNFSGTDGGNPANLIPFKTIVPYILGDKGYIIAGVNLLGNILPLVPLGFLAVCVYKNLTWKTSLLLAIASGLVIEIIQVVLRVGIFDIDDVILNAFGVMLGYWTFRTLTRWIHAKKYAHIGISGLLLFLATGLAFYAIYPKEPLRVNRPNVGPVSQQSQAEQGAMPEQGDLCGGTGGIGEITATGDHTITLKKKDGKELVAHFTDKVEIKTSSGSNSVKELTTGKRVTLVGYPTSDGSFAAETIVVCSVE